MPGQVYQSSSQLVKLRKMQLLDLARAYEIPVDHSLPKSKVLRILEAKEDEGVFLRPPKNLYYFEKAKFNADQVRDAKFNGGYTRDGILVTTLHPWHGPPSEPEKPKPTIEEVKAKKSETQRQNSLKSPMAMLRKEAKELGINSFAKGADELARLIAEKKGQMQKVEA